MRDFAEAVESWQNNGWVVIDGLIPADVVGTAFGELQAVLAAGSPTTRSGPVRRADELRNHPDTDDDGPRFRNRQFDNTTSFPYPGTPSLNRLFVHPALTAFAAEALETEDIRIYQSRIWSKFGGYINYEQPHHLDRNHSLVPVRQGPPWGHVECFLYLHDVDDDSGAPRLVPGSAAGRNGLGVGEGLGGAGTGSPVTREEAPDLYANEVSASGVAGSLLAYRSDVWHRGVDIPAGVERHVAVIAYRPAAVDWIGFDAHEPMVNRADFVAFAEQCTPDELALFGVPRPGHEFWTAEVLDVMQRIYPGLDLTPWRSQLLSGS